MMLTASKLSFRNISDKTSMSARSSQGAGASAGGDLEAACFHLGSGGEIKSPPEDFSKTTQIDFRQNYKPIQDVHCRSQMKQNYTEVRICHFHPKTGLLPLGHPEGAVDRPPPH